MRKEHGMSTTRLTVAQALVTFLTQQYVERDGHEQYSDRGQVGGRPAGAGV